MENVYAPYEMGHYLKHGVGAGPGAHAAAALATPAVTTASQTAQVLKESSPPAMAEMVEELRRAGASPKVGQVATAMPASQAAQVLKTPSPPAMAEMVENLHQGSAIAAVGPAATATPASQAAQALKTPSTSAMADMVENIHRTQAADQAAFTASRAVPAATPATAATGAATTTEAASGSRAASTLRQAAPEVTTFGRVMGGLGVLGGGVEVYEGIQDLRDGQVQQGMLDLTAGASGIGAGLLALAKMSYPPAGLAVAGLGIMAYGNKYTKNQAWWGHNAQGKNRSALDWMGESTAAAYQGTRQALGGGVLGSLGGGLTAGLTALNTGAIAVLGDVVGGAIGAVRDVGHLAGRIGQR